MKGFRGLILKLGGKKFAAMIGGVVALLVVALLRALSGHYGFNLSDDMINAITLKITGIVVAFCLGQGFADGLSRGATSSAVWPQQDAANASSSAPSVQSGIPASQLQSASATQLHDELVRRGNTP